MIKDIAFTVYPVRDLAQVRRFYEKDLGLNMTMVFENAWVEYTLPNGTFALTTMMEWVKPSASVGGIIAFEVDDVDRLAQSLKEKGYSFKVNPFSTPVCRMAVVLDPEGNPVTLHKINQPKN